MNQPHILLAAVAAGDTDPKLDPVQIQHLLFLYDQEVADWVGGPHFAFAPSSFGPFDQSIRDVLRELCGEGLVHMLGKGDDFAYVLTKRGFAQGSHLLSSFDPKVITYLGQVVTWIQTHHYKQRLAILQTHYPDMILGRLEDTADSSPPEPARRRLVTNYARQSSLQAFLIGLARIVDASGTLSSNDQFLKALRESRDEKHSVEEIWTAVGDELRESMALHSCGPMHSQLDDDTRFA